MKGRIYNFNAGPAALPLPVLQEIQGEFLNFKGSGMSITEVSHRSQWFDEVIEDAVARVRRLMKLPDSFHVVFLQGGASMQFCMIPMNLLPEGRSADYVNTGTWATKTRNFPIFRKTSLSAKTQPTSTSLQTTPSKEPNGPLFLTLEGVP
jgi:phosphoserine aminotransferase